MHGLLVQSPTVPVFPNQRKLSSVACFAVCLNCADEWQSRVGKQRVQDGSHPFIQSVHPSGGGRYRGRRRWRRTHARLGTHRGGQVSSFRVSFFFLFPESLRVVALRTAWYVRLPGAWCVCVLRSGKYLLVLQFFPVLCYLLTDTGSISYLLTYLLTVWLWKCKRHKHLSSSLCKRHHKDSWWFIIITSLHKSRFLRCGVVAASESGGHRRILGYYSWLSRGSVVCTQCSSLFG